MIFRIIKAIAIILSISGAVLVASKTQKRRFIGWCIWMISNVIWLANAISYDDFLQSILWGVYIIICMKGIYTNKKNEI